MAGRLAKAWEVRVGHWIEVRGETGVWVWDRVARIVDLSYNSILAPSYRIETENSAPIIMQEGSEVVLSEEDPISIPNRKDNPTWDEYFLNFARAAGMKAKCRRRQVGAVLVDQNNRIISTGYAGFPAGTKGDCLTGHCPRGLTRKGDIPPDSPYDDPESPGYCPSIHAESNVIFYAGRETRGATIYITDSPCPNCMKHLAAAGVVRAVWPDGETNPIKIYENM